MRPPKPEAKKHFHDEKGTAFVRVNGVNYAVREGVYTPIA